MTTETCPGCAVTLEVVDGPTHPYILATPSCWAAYGRVLARRSEAPDVQQVAVDTYAVQHPGTDERRAVQSVALHLMTLCLVFEQDADPRDGSRLHARMAHRDGYRRLAPPARNGTITAAGVAVAPEHREAVLAWGRDVWEAWAEHHATVRAWIQEALG